MILGKANLSEWANFRGFAPFNGWTARGGFTRDPYLLSADPCGSSSGSAVAAAANLCAVAVGTETDGSIVCPVGQQSRRRHQAADRDGSGRRHHPDRAQSGHRGTDSPHGHRREHPARRAREHAAPAIFAAAHCAARASASTGRCSAPHSAPETPTNAVVEAALAVMTELGATLVDTTTGDPLAYGDAEFTVLLWEFKVQIAEYLAGVSGTSIRTLADLIAFNLANCSAEMHYFGQEVFEMAEATGGDLTAPEYLDARALCLRLARDEGIDAAIARDDLDAIVAPSFSYGSIAGRGGRLSQHLDPGGHQLRGSARGHLDVRRPRQHPRNSSDLAFDLEQELQARTQPQLARNGPARTARRRAVRTRCPGPPRGEPRRGHPPDAPTPTLVTPARCTGDGPSVRNGSLQFRATAVPVTSRRRRASTTTGRAGDPAARARTRSSRVRPANHPRTAVAAPLLRRSALRSSRRQLRAPSGRG